MTEYLNFIENGCYADAVSIEKKENLVSVGGGFIPAVLVIVFMMLSIAFVPGVEAEEKKNDIRVVVMNEQLRINDSSGNFFLKRPRNIKIASDGSIFFVDQDQLLRFDHKGAFLGNFQKKGEGPAEYSYMFNYDCPGEKIVVYASVPRKVLQFDLNGKLLEEYRFGPLMNFTRVLGTFGKGFWFIGTTFSEENKQFQGHITVNLDLAQKIKDKKFTKSGVVFPEKWYLINRKIGKNNQIAMTTFVPALLAMDRSGTLFASCSRKYKIQRIDLDKGRVDKEFSRAYDSITYSEPVSKREPGKRPKRRIIPNPKYFNDVQKLLINRDRVWVFTSTVKKEKGVLVDVFSFDGKYIDCFYLRLPQVESVYDLQRKSLTICDNKLYTFEEAVDGNPELVKYIIR